MNASLMALIVLSSVLLGVTQGVPMSPEEEELNSQALDYMYDRGYPVMDKRRTLGRPRLADYLKMAAVEYELDKEAEAAEAAQNEELLAPSGDAKSIDDPEAHSVEKRHYPKKYTRNKYSYPAWSRRYGFWVTAINKMGNHKRSVMGRYKGHPLMMAA